MINTVVVQGNICADIELKQTQNGTQYTRFNIAINEKTKDSEKTYFIPVQAWRHTAEFIQKYFRKGSQIGIEGKLTQRTYTDNSGIKHNIIEIVANSVHFLGNKNGNSAAAPQQQPPQAQPPQQQQGAGNNSGAGCIDLSEYDEILSDGDVPF